MAGADPSNTPVVQYPQDTSGKSPGNRIVREPQVTSDIDPRTKNILVPNFAPIFPNDFVLETQNASGNFVALRPEVDYEFTLPWYSLRMETGIEAYGGVKVHNKPTTPMLFVSYQTFGGTFTADRRKVMEALANYIWNPRIAQFDQFTNVQETFPPNQHKQNLENYTRWDDVVVVLNKMVEAMGNPVNPTLLYQRETIYLREQYDVVLARLLEVESEMTVMKRQIAELQRRI